MNNDEKILKFISTINRLFNETYEAEIGEPATVVFFDGGSYYYAKMLESVFPGGDIYYSSSANIGEEEVLYKLGDRFYYVDGFVEEKNCKGHLLPLMEHPEFIESISIAMMSSAIEYGKANGYLLGLAERLKLEFRISSKPQSPEGAPYIM